VDFSDNTMENAELCAAILEHPAYAMDNQTAIRFEKGVAEVISEYEWIEYN
jgi:dipeptidase E